MNDFVKMQQLYLESVPVASNKGTIPNDYITLKYNQSPPGSGMDINRRTSNSGFKKGQIPLGARGDAPGFGEGQFTTVIDEEESTLTRGEIKAVIAKELDEANEIESFALHALANKLGITIQPS